MGSFTCYFDASGHPNDPAVTHLFVSGFIATEHKWLRFEPEWRKFVRKCEMDHFRASKFYAMWREEPRRRDELLREGAGIIRRFTRKSFSAGVDLAVHREFYAKYEIPMGLDTPYALAGGMVVRNTLRYLVRSKTIPREPWVLFLFEDGDHDKGKLYTALKGFDKGQLTPHFGKKEDHPGLQAGDLLAWHHARMLRDGRVPLGDALAVLGTQMRTKDDCWTISDSQWYEEGCKRWNPR